MTEADEVMDLVACAQLLRCDSLVTVAMLARQGRIPAVKIGRSWTFLKSQVLEAFREMAAQEAAQRRERRASGLPGRVLDGYEWTGKPGRPGADYRLCLHRRPRRSVVAVCGTAFLHRRSADCKSV